MQPLIMGFLIKTVSFIYSLLNHFNFLSDQYYTAIFNNCEHMIHTPLQLVCDTIIDFTYSRYLFTVHQLWWD